MGKRAKSKSKFATDEQVQTPTLCKKAEEACLRLARDAMEWKSPHSAAGLRRVMGSQT